MKKYKINEIFYSIQGEGFNAGSAAVFIRFSGCNLKCDFCDTDFDSFENLDAHDIMRKIAKCLNEHDASTSLVVLTGGEPALQVDDELLSYLKLAGFKIAIETNGTILLPDTILFDWITVSPKKLNSMKQLAGSELKLVFPDSHIDLDVITRLIETNRIMFRHFYLQPKDDEFKVENTLKCINYIKSHPRWKLSVQIQKYINVR